MSKILILTASPVRDEVIDFLIKEALEELGHKVSVRPCLREGRAALADEVNHLLNGEEGFIPDIVVLPPIRNPYSRDMAETFKHWGLGVVSRHTEPSCDRADFEKMKPHQRMDIFGKYSYEIDAELVWSEQEAEILARRKAKFPTVAVGAFAVDAYMREDIIAKHRDKIAFCNKYQFDFEKKTLLICSPWGFADAAPDLHIDDLDFAKKDKAGMERHLQMIEFVSVLKDTWNILITTHPGVVQQPYKDVCKRLGLPLDTESTSFYLTVNVDAIVHAGSTMAIGAHLFGIPAYQFGDVYCKDADNWWMDPESAISKISPYFKDPKDLLEALRYYQPGTNANADALKELEKGRFGVMDGKATQRAAEIIDKVKGKFTFKWPKGSIYDYSQLTIVRDNRIFFTETQCNICQQTFYLTNESYLGRLTQHVFNTIEPHLKAPIPQEVLQEMWVRTRLPFCPWCAARYLIHE